MQFIRDVNGVIVNMRNIRKVYVKKPDKELSHYYVMAEMDGFGGAHILKASSERWECEDFIDRFFCVVNEDNLDVIGCCK